MQIFSYSFVAHTYFRTTKGVILTWFLLLVFLPFTPGVVVYLLLHSIQYCCSSFSSFGGSRAENPSPPHLPGRCDDEVKPSTAPRQVPASIVQ